MVLFVAGGGGGGGAVGGAAVGVGSWVSGLSVIDAIILSGMAVDEFAMC